jgi:hypothetical protein
MSDVQDMGCDTRGWLTIVRQLSERSSGPPEPPVAAISSGTGQAEVHPVERLTPRTVTVDWCEPGACHYTEQTWVAGAANRSGHCAVTGKVIRRGDPIYRPRPTRPPTQNAAAMIAAEQILKLPQSWTD